MAYKKIIIGIETSCDDTSIAIIADGKILSNKTFTKFKDHQKFGGIIPELAARNHANHLLNVFNDVLKEAKITSKQIDYIAYTAYPGLIGCLHTGKVFAKTLALVLNKPLIKINHMLAHAFSFSIEKSDSIKYPFLCLDVSGGHTIIYLFKGLNKYRIINQSNDDAVGECLDKIGRILKLPYPGGISLDNQFDPKQTSFPLIKHSLPQKPFSFSGIKTFITNKVHQAEQKNEPINKVLIGSSALKWCFDEIMIKLNYYISRYNVQYLAIGGGVAANSLLRNEIKKIPINVELVDKKYCGDNAAMIAHLAYLTILKKENSI